MPHLSLYNGPVLSVEIGAVCPKTPILPNIVELVISKIEIFDSHLDAIASRSLDEVLLLAKGLKVGMHPFLPPTPWVSFSSLRGSLTTKMPTKGYPKDAFSALSTHTLFVLLTLLNRLSNLPGWLKKSVHQASNPG